MQVVTQVEAVASRVEDDFRLHLSGGISAIFRPTLGLLKGVPVT